MPKNENKSERAEPTKNLVQEFKEQGTARLAEIREIVAPLLSEEAELAPMVGESVQFTEASKNGSAAAPEPSESPAPSEGAPRKRRNRKGGTRADQAVSLITERPGIGASAIASEMSIKPNYLYRVLGDLEKEGRVKKEGREYFPAT